MDVVLCWHMHQPDYRLRGVWQRPWTWLHAIKDYTDMAAHLENVRGARAVINFSPVLLLQLQTLAERLAQALAEDTPIGDPLLDALAGRWVADEPALQRALLRVHEQNMAGRFAAYRRLAEAAAAALRSDGVLPGPARNDLLCWYTLCWLGESVRQDARAVRLQARDADFSPEQRRLLLELVTDHIAGLIPRYRALAESGTAELSVTPYSHPILPLLQDFGVAREALPGLALPDGAYPGGSERCDWQLREAVAVYRAAFGRTPRGCWPSEGGISEATLRQLGRHGFDWTASGSRVLYNSLDEHDWPHLSAWRLEGGSGPACFFRDDGLSDRLGFVYATWSATDAVADFVRHLEQVRGQAPSGRPALLAIIMDGENAWEYYHENGWSFLHGLYRALADHPGLRLTTFAEALDRLEPRRLAQLRAGSWVHGTFSTWIGNAPRNRAWSLLADAKRAVDAALAGAGAAIDDEKRRVIGRQLALCEASDWFWWLDESNPHPDVSEFDALYRAQLTALYRMVGQRPPSALGEPLLPLRDTAPPSSEPAAGTMRRSE